MLEKDTISQINRKQVANIFAKLKAGKVLTKHEQKLIEQQVSEETGTVSISAKVENGQPLTEDEKANLAKGNVTGLTRVPSKVALAKLFSVNRATIDEWSKMDGAPVPTSANRHDVLAWAKFIMDKGLHGNMTIRNEPLQRRKLRAQCEKIEAEVEIVKGNWISRQEVRSAADAITDALIKAIEQFPVPFDLQPKERQIRDELRSSLHDAIVQQPVLTTDADSGEPS